MISLWKIKILQRTFWNLWNTPNAWLKIVFFMSTWLSSKWIPSMKWSKVVRFLIVNLNYSYFNVIYEIIFFQAMSRWYPDKKNTLRYTCSIFKSIAPDSYGTLSILIVMKRISSFLTNQNIEIAKGWRPRHWEFLVHLSARTVFFSLSFLSLLLSKVRLCMSF